jgi:hypothetical protein
LKTGLILKKQRRKKIMLNKTLAWGFLLFVLFAFAVGCNKSDGRVTVKGNVTFDGTPLDMGAVTFFPKGSGVSSGGSIEKGLYTSDLMPGSYIVQITANRETGKMLPVPPGEPPIKEYEQYIPAKYNTKSELTIEVDKKSKQEFNFTLELK